MDSSAGNRKKALVVGATGLVGGALLDQLQPLEDWDAVAISRRRPEGALWYEHIPVDLMDANSSRERLAHLSDVTHVFFAAYAELPDLHEWVGSNLTLLRNLMDAIEPVAPGLVHVNLMHGTKWYGCHLGPFKTPAKEDDARHMPPNFYYEQWDYLRDRQQGKAWTYSSARPHGICGFAVGNPNNLLTVIAVYATISKALGLPLCHPGTPGNYRALYQCTDAALLARAVIWMSTTPACAGEAFNITNGDLIRWENTWPRIAEYFGMPLGPRRRLSLLECMADKAPVWNALVKRFGLRPYTYAEIAAWRYGDFVFTPEFDIISDVGKARRLGFNETVDTEEMLFRLWDRMRADRIIPR